MNASRLENRNVFASAGRTSMRLEPELWDALRDLAQAWGTTEDGVIRAAEARYPGQRTSAVRTLIVQALRGKVPRPVRGEQGEMPE